MRAKLTNKASIPAVLADLTVDEKLNLVGAYTACSTLAVPDMNIPSIWLVDGVTGVNSTQLIIDYATAPTVERKTGSRAGMGAMAAMMDVGKMDLEKAREEYRDDPMMLGALEYVGQFRPNGRQFISFPSGINIGAGFDPEAAERIGQAVGWEMRNSGVDITLGPNVDIARDPLGGRNYEMYGEDPHLVSRMAVGFIRGIQSTGVGACAKHFLANNQETNRNSKNTHVSERTLREIYSRGFEASVKEARTKSVMSAYNAINGEYSTYSKKFLTDWLKEEWGFEGMVVSDWGAARKNKEDALTAGLDLVLNGPNDMSACKQALEEGRFSEEVLDRCVAALLRTIVELREEQAMIPAVYEPEYLMETACDIIARGSVLLKNNNNLLPLNGTEKVLLCGKHARELLEFGSGSTAVTTQLQGDLYQEIQQNCAALLQGGEVFLETADGAGILVYPVSAPAGENIDRSSMDIEEEDRQLLPEKLKWAKEKGMKTVVILNIAGPVDMRDWIDDADAVLTIFIPGCMGARATAELLYGIRYPGGKLPVTMPLRYQDTPSYPNFPGEHNDVYYGEGIFVGYRSYEKREIPVLFPFGHGLSYTEFEVTVPEQSLVLDVREQESVNVLCQVKNIGKHRGSQVIQVYSSEVKPHILRPVKELAGFTKVELEPGEAKTISVPVCKDALRCYDQKFDCWVQPIGAHKLWIGTSSAEIVGEVDLQVLGKNTYALGSASTMGEILRNPKAVELVNEYTGGMIDKLDENSIIMMHHNQLGDFLGRNMVNLVPDATKLNRLLEELYEKLAEL